MWGSKLRSFEKWHELSLRRGIVLPDLDGPVTASKISALLTAMMELQSAAQDSSFDSLLETSASLVEDILEAQSKTSDQLEQLLLQYLQFEVSIAPIKAAIGRGRFDFAFDWIHNGLSDKVGSSAEREFFLERPWRFIGKLVDILPTSFPNSFLEWADIFFYYCRHQSALQTQAIEVARIVSATVFVLPATTDLAVKAAVSLMCWGRDVGHEGALVVATELKRRFSEEELSMSNKALIAKAFSTRSCDLVGDRHYVWARVVLNDFADLLFQHEPFQYLFASFENVTDWDANIEHLLEAAKKYSTEVKQSFPKHTDWLISLDQRSNLLSPVAKFSLDNDRSEDFAKVLAAWYDGEVDTSAAGCSVVLPTAISGVGFLGPSAEMIPFRGHFVGADKVVEAMNDVTNKALGTTRTVQAGPELDRAPDRRGQPNRNFAAEFEALLIDFYNIPMIAEKLAGTPSFTCFPHSIHPLQALLAREAQASWPLSSSLRTPLQNRPVRRVAIWASCADWYSEMESRSASNFFHASGVETHLYLGSESGRSDFLKMYNCQSYDYIHVIGHGAFDHLELGSSRILINQSEFVAIDDLVDANLGKQGRRLLCLNICDGGVSDGLGGIQKLGLAPSLASPSQAVISHLWPVEPRVASAFGLTLCSNLVSTQKGHFEAFSTTLKRLQEPWMQRVATLRAHFDGEIIDRLENFAAADDIFDWASPVFFQ